MGTTLCSVWSRAVSVAMMPRVSDGTGMVSVLARRHADTGYRPRMPCNAELRVLLSDLASGKPAGVVGFVLQPDSSLPRLLGFRDYELHLGHVLRP